MSGFIAWLGALVAVVLAIFTGKRWISTTAKAEAREEIAQQATTDALETRKRIDDATRIPAEPDVARDRLRRFGAGTKPPAER